MPSESLSLPNGGLWPDVAGVHVNAHGGGLLKEGGLWYWYGEHKTAGRGVNPANGLGPEKTWGAQSTFSIPPDETTGGRWIAMFDLWRPEDAIDGRYAWLPADFRDGRLEISWRDTFPPGKSE